jgi:peptidoglycan/LPS O-acetylase OafA/YrhL
MVLVFSIHVAEPYNPWDLWHIQSPERTKWLGAFVLVLAPWVMPLFMLLAGAASAYALRTRTSLQYVEERVRRLLIPLVLAILVVVPPQVYLERRLRGQFNGSYVQFYPRFFEGVYPAGNFSWHHLWFLGYLFAFALLTLPLFRYLEQPAGRRWTSRLADLCERSGAVLLFAFVLLAWRILVWVVVPGSHTLSRSFANRDVLLPAYVIGFLYVSEPRIEAAIARAWRLALLPAMAATAGLLAWAWPGDVLRRMPAPFTAADLALWTAYSVGAWCWLVVVLGVARHLRTARSRALEHARELVYPFYILHQLVIVAIAYYLVRSPLPLQAKVALLAVTSFAATLALCEVCARWNPARALFGMKPRSRSRGAPGALRLEHS